VYELICSSTYRNCIN